MSEQVNETKINKKNSIPFKQENHGKLLENNGFVNHGYDHCDYSEPKNIDFNEKVNVYQLDEITFNR